MTTSHFIYIAQNPQDRENLLKIGFTRGNPETRRNQLRGTVLTDFKLLRVFETTDGPAAERLAHLLLDGAGARTGLNSRREHFNIALKDAVAMCEKAIAFIKRTNPAKHRTSPALSATLPSPFVTHHRRHWKSLLAMPVRFDNRALSLGELMAMALNEGRAARRLKALGVSCSYFDQTKPEFSIHWGQAPTLKAWCDVSNTNLPKISEISQSTFKVIKPGVL